MHASARTRDSTNLPSLVKNHFCAFLMVLCVTALPAFASEPERPVMLWFGAGGGLACEKNEQYSPLTYTGPAFRLEGGWAIRGQYLLWDGQIGYSSGTVTSSRTQGYTITTQLLTGETGVLYLLPPKPFSTTFGLGVSLEVDGIFTDGIYNHEADLYSALFFGGGPAILIENKSLDRWTFRLHLSMPLALYSWGPAWANYSGGETTAEWHTIPDILFLEAKASAGLRVTQRVEALLLFSCIAERYETAFVSRRLHNYVGLGLEIDFGDAR